MRLSFHDAFGEGTSPNGCIDFSEPDNNGLQTIVAQLAASWAPFSSSISRADYWVLAATLAIQYASTPAAAGGGGRLPPSPGVLTLPFVSGRVDAATCNDAGRLPGAGLTWAQSAAFFGRVGLSVVDIVALFGAHALGRAEFQNSGFDGGWTTTQSSFSNSYYSQMLGIPWANNNASDIWLNGGSRPNTIRLRSDAEVAIAPASGCPRFGGGGGGGAVSTPTCPFNTLTQATLASFSGSTAAWYAAFAPAWAKMVGAGYTTLAAPIGTVAPANAAATGSANLSGNSVAVIAGSAAGGAVLFALVAALVVVACRRRSNAATAVVSARAPVIAQVSDDPADAAVSVPVAMPAAYSGAVLQGIPVPIANTQPILVRDVSGLSQYRSMSMHAHSYM